MYSAWIILITTLLFAIPFALFPASKSYAWMYTSSVTAMLIIAYHTRTAHHHRKRAAPVNMRVLALSVAVFALLYNYADTTALRERALTREGLLNFSETRSQFTSIQLRMVGISIAAYMLARYYIHRTTKPLILGLSIAIYLFIESGTRWYLLLAVAPLVILFPGTTKLPVQIFAAGIFASTLTVFAAIRSGGAISSLQEILTWDIPSIQSYAVITTRTGNLSGIVDFINGNILSLVPRFVWPSKPEDIVTREFMTNAIGDAYYQGATILPGFLGSAWLYAGGWGGVLFAPLLAISLRKSEKEAHSTKSALRLAIASLIGIGAALQLRNISVMYFAPAIYLILLSALKRLSKAIKKAI